MASADPSPSSISHQQLPVHSLPPSDFSPDPSSRIRAVASWLQRKVGPLSFSDEPSDAELLQILQDGNVLSNLLDSVVPGLTTHWDARNSVRNFLSAAAELKLPLFELSDLDSGRDQPSGCERIIDTLLSLKSYSEFRHGCDESSESLGTTTAHHVGDSVQKSPPSRRRWSGSQNENIAESSKQVASAVSLSAKSFGKDCFQTDENFVPRSGQPGIGLTSTNIQQISHKFREILRHKYVEQSTVLSSLDNVPSKSLSEVAASVLGEKQQEETVGVVEHMMKKVLEEFERRLAMQTEHVMKLKRMLKEHIEREDKFISRMKLLETLVAGAGEEVKIVSSQLQKMKAEKTQAEVDKLEKDVLIAKLLKELEEKEAHVEDLKKELEFVKHSSHEQFEQLEQEKCVLEKMLRVELKERDVLLEQAQNKVHELEAMSEVEIKALKKRSERYQSILVSQLDLFHGTKVVLQGVKQDVHCLQSTWQDNFEDLEKKLQGLVHAASGYYKVLAENRQLYNEVQDLKGNIRVYCRVRPFLPGQSVKQSCVEFLGENGLSIFHPMKQGKDSRKIFSFNKVFRPTATQEEVFMDTRPLITSVLDGFNVCIFAYGQTGSGKTFTMSGPSSISKEDWGVNYRALDDLFEICKSRKNVINYEVVVQMIEIYNEQVRDLLYIDNSNRRLGIRNNSQLNGLNVPDACMFPVNSTDDVLKLLNIGLKNRAVGATALNERSSRSHSVLTIHVRGLEQATDSVLHGCLHLVDLAGSERVDRSEAKGDRLKEAQHINKSLSALGDVISALSHKNAHVPYRNSKLTQLLQDSLGGQAKTLMFVHISPDVESYGETISTLKFAERVASVELGAARSNKESKELRDLKEQIAVLKDIIARKDADIFRLQGTKIINEGAAASVKSKVRLTQSVSQKLSGDAFRRQTFDMKRLVGRSSRDFETTASLSSSGTGSLRPESSAIPSNGSSFRKLKVSTVRMDETEKQCISPSKEWRNWLQNSTDSSLMETGSLDDVCCSWDAEITDACSLPDIETSLSLFEPADSDVCTEVLSNASQRNIDDEDEPLQQLKDLDVGSEHSEECISNSSVTSVPEQNNPAVHESMRNVSMADIV